MLPDAEEWAAQEFGDVKLGDKRREERACLIGHMAFLLPATFHPFKMWVIVRPEGRGLSPVLVKITVRTK